MNLNRLKTKCLTLFCCLFLISTAIQAQSVLKITIKRTNITLREAFTEVERQSKMSINYNQSQLGNRRISLNLNNQSLEKTLQTILKGTGYTYKINKSYILILQDKDAQSKITQTSNIGGRVIDSHGEPIIGATVKIEGTSDIAITNMQGQFSIDAKPTDILIVSYLGYIEKKVKIGAKKRLQITLEEEQQLLDEVIVVGYGTTTRRSAVGAVDQIRSDMIENRPVANVTQALQGASPNLIIQQKSQNPNDNSTNINIRGVSTFNDNSPLIVIDGLVSDQTSLNSLNPMDIDNVSVLKDAGTVAIYGSRSANGVILVTTKKGNRNERPKVRLTAMMGWENANILFEPVQGYQNAILTNMAETNVGNAAKFTPEQIQDLYDHRNEERWQMYEIFQTAPQQNYNISVSGGSEHTTYMVSLGYYNQGSNYVSNQNFGINRYNIRTHLTTEWGRLKIDANLAYIRNNSRSTDGGSLEINASRVPPYYYYKQVDEQGHYLVNDVVGDFSSLGQLNSGGFNKYRGNAINANVQAELSIINGLKLKGVVGADINDNMRYTRHKPVTYYYSDGTQRSVDASGFTTENWNSDSYLINVQALLDFNRTFNDKHKVSALLGITNEAYTYSANEITKKYVDPNLGVSTSETTSTAGNITGATTVDNQTRTNITSVIGRAGYSYADRYYGEFNFRYDGSSKFAKDYRWGFFPSLSLGWRVSEEPFMKSYKDNVGELKLRTSYGILGSQAIEAYDRYTVYTTYSDTYAFNNTSVTGTGFTLGLDDITWEKTHTFNVGIDATLLNNTLTLTFDAYYKRTKDILMTPVVPSVYGTSMPKDNLGEMSNRGWEASINYHLNHGNFHHEFSLNVGDSYNKVEKFVGNEQISSSDEIYRLIRVGIPMNSYYGYECEGIFQSYEEIETHALPSGVSVSPGDLKFKDQNDDGIIDSKDRVILGNAFPRYTFGFNYNLSWRDWDFGMFWQGVGKRDQMLRGELMEPFHDNYSYVIYKHQLDFWTSTNTDAKFPKLSSQGSGSDANNWDQPSDIYLLDCRYARLKNIVLGYTLPKNISKKIGMEKCRLYVNSQNLLTLCKNSFIDPESSEFGSNMNASGANSGRNYPSLRYYGFGIDIEF